MVAHEQVVVRERVLCEQADASAILVDDEDLRERPRDALAQLVGRAERERLPHLGEGEGVGPG